MAPGMHGSRTAKTPQTNWEHCDAVPTLAEESRFYPRGGWNKHDRGGLFIRWPAFIGRREVGRDTTGQMTRRAFGAAGVCPLRVPTWVFVSPAYPAGRGRGHVLGVDGPEQAGHG